MDSSSIVKKIVEMVNETPEPPNEEDLPIEYYELREIAKRKILLKASLKAHTVIFLIASSFMLITNLTTSSYTTIYDIWALIPIWSWMIVLWIHFCSYLTYKVSDFRKKMFYFDAAIVVAINPFIIYINNFVNHYAPLLLNYTATLWWPYIVAISLVVIAIHGYLAFTTTITDEKKLEANIEKEMLKMQKAPDHPDIENTEKTE